MFAIWAVYKSVLRAKYIHTEPVNILEKLYYYYSSIYIFYLKTSKASMVGYNGCTILEAKKLIDGSQGKPAFGNRALGHPRGHAAVEPGVSAKMAYVDCVENYSAG